MAAIGVRLLWRFLQHHLPRLLWLPAKSGEWHLLESSHEKEPRILNGIKDQLLKPEMVKHCGTAVRTEWNRMNREPDEANHRRSDELTSVKRKIAGIVGAIEDGEWTASLKARLRELEQRRADLESKSAKIAPPPNLRLHPSMAD